MKDIKLGDRFWSKVNKSADNGCWEWIAYRNNLGYGKFSYNGKPRRSHRLSYAEANGPIPDGLSIDHKCHNPACVNPEHLQAVPHAVNMQNFKAAFKTSKTGVRGVSWDKAKKKWRVNAVLNYKQHHIGYFEDFEDAKAASIRWRRTHFSNSLSDHNIQKREAAS